MGLTQKLGTIPLAIFTDSSNNVGIGGAANASYKFQVTGNANFTSTVNGFNWIGTSNSTFALYYNNSSSFVGGFGTYSWQTGNSNYSDLALVTLNNFAIFTGNSNTPSIYVNSSKNVGIGTSSPSSIAKLDILLDATAVNGLQIRTSDVGSVDGSTTANVFRTVNSGGGNWANAKYNAWDHIFTTSGTTERMRINSSGSSSFSGNVNINDTYGLYMGVGGEQRILAGGTTVNTYLTFSSWTGSAYAERISITTTGRLEVKTEGIVSQKGASASVGGGSFLAVQQTAAGGGERWILQQLNTSYGLDYWAYNGSGWNVIANLSSAGVWYSSGGGTSDKRTKQNIEYINTSGIDAISLLKPVKFEFIKCPEKTRRGFIAQDVLEVIPDLVLGDGENEDGIYGLDYDGILALAVKAIQELKAEIEAQQQQINSLINR